MLGNRLTRRLTPRRLAILLSVFFLLLAIPTVALVWHAYGQLKWESFHLHRSQAESLRERIDAQLLDIMRQTDSRPVGDFSFQSSTGLSPDEPILRSPLAGLSPAPAMPGLIGYFQVRSDGTFSSPVLPAVGVDPDSVGISHDELNERRMHAARIREILADNRLVRDSGTGLDEAAAATNGNNAAAKERSRSMAPSSPRQSNATEQEEDPAAASATQRFATPESGRGAGNDSAGGRARPAGQVVFDSLNQPDSQQAPSNRNELAETDRRASPGSALEATVNPVPKKVRDLGFDDTFEQRSTASPDAEPGPRERTAPRSIRRESVARNVSPAQSDMPDNDLASDNENIRIHTFESEVDPFEFSLLQSGHFVLFRNVWQESERTVQGALLDSTAFLEGTVDAAFLASNLSDIASVFVAYQETIIHTLDGARPSAGLPATLSGDNGLVLYRSYLSDPLQNLALIFAVHELSAGPGENLLWWFSLVLTVLLIGGFLILYRLGTGQLRLAQQQTDFVAAVSHELKTPLTSIRMYSEILNEGWADKEKQKEYFAFIHEESERLSRMIARVLQLAKMSENQVQPALRETSVESLLTSLRTKIEQFTESSGFDAVFNCDSTVGPASISVDPDSFLQIGINLVENAIKFSKDADNKTIEISAQMHHDDAVEFSVRDFGPGIAKNQRKRIFGMFYRAPNEHTQEIAGTGIGLTIVKQLVQSMHGTINIEDLNPGTRFVLTFPLSR